MLALRTPAKALLALTPILVGWAATSARLNLVPESTLWVEGTSTVRSFKCAAGALDAEIATSRPDAAGAVLGGEKAVTTLLLTIPAAKLDCSNGTMNDHMRKAIKAEANPTIAFELGSYDLVTTEKGLQAKLAGTLTLGGTRKEITLDADLTRDPSGRLRVKGTYPLRMTEYGLKPPSLMMGTLKVNELVKIGFDLLLEN